MPMMAGREWKTQEYMRNYPRAKRVEALIHEELSTTLLKKIQDPRLVGVTITGVKVSDDLATARVYFCVSNRPNAKKEAQEGFKKAYGFIKHELASVLGLRYMPGLFFNYDESLEYGQRIDEVMRSISQEKPENEA